MKSKKAAEAKAYLESQGSIEDIVRQRKHFEAQIRKLEGPRVFGFTVRRRALTEGESLRVKAMQYSIRRLRDQERLRRQHP